MCARPPFADTTPYTKIPVCGACRERGQDALVRPDIVWFGEQLTEGAMERILTFVRRADEDLVFIAVGMSGLVYPAAGLVDAARSAARAGWSTSSRRP